MDKKNNTWYRFWKTYRNGTVETYKLLSGNLDKETIDEFCLDWAEKEPSGQSYGYEYFWEKVEIPPKEKILDKLKGAEFRLHLAQSEIDELTEELKYYSRKAKIERIKEKIK